MELSSVANSDFSGLATVKSTLEELVIVFNPSIEDPNFLITCEQADLTVLSELENLTHRPR
jgi:hypothetical protein